MSDRLGDRTIRDFGRQWTAYRDNVGFYGSVDLFWDIFGRLIDPEEVKDARVADIGSGTGRIVSMLLAAGAAHVTALEPSAAFGVLADNLADRKEQVTLLNLPGDELPPTGDQDFVFSVGVLHHIPQPDPVVQAARGALKPGGRLAVWLYGREGNRLYIAAVKPLRALGRLVGHRGLARLAGVIYPFLAAYIGLCRFLPLPLSNYMVNVIGRMSPAKRRLVIYDQLNPAYAKYYSGREAADLLTRNGFIDVVTHHRRGYSWSVVGVKPSADNSRPDDLMEAG